MPILPAAWQNRDQVVDKIRLLTLLKYTEQLEQHGAISSKFNAITMKGAMMSVTNATSMIAYK